MNITICTFEAVVEEGAANTTDRLIEALPTDIYIISYTSGTTGDPKGVKLSHNNLLVNVCATV